MKCFGELFKRKKKHVGRSNQVSTSSVYSLVEQLGSPEFLSLCPPDSRIKWRILQVEVNLCKMFLIFVANLRDLDRQPSVSGVGQEMESLALDLDNAFKDACHAFGVAYGVVSHSTRDDFRDAITKLHQKLTLLRPQMKEAYAFVSNISLKSLHPLSRWPNWCHFYSSLYTVLSSLCDREGQLQNHLYIPLEGKLQEHVYIQLFAMLNMLHHIHTYIKSAPHRTFTAHYEASLVRTAHVSYLCWIHLMDEHKSQELIVMLSDLLKELNPYTSEAIQMCFLNISKFNTRFHAQKSVVQAFLNFLIPEKDPRLETFYKELAELIMFVSNNRRTALYAEEDLGELLFMDVRAAICKLGSFGFTFHVKMTTRDRAEEPNPAMFWLLEKTELLRAEAFLIELLNQKISFEFLKNYIDSFHDKLMYLQGYYTDAFQGKSKVPKLIWLHIPTLARDAGSVYQSFHANLVTIEKLRDELLKLREKIKLLKTEILLEELLIEHPEYIVNVKDQIENLDQMLIICRAYLMGPLEENEKLILAQAESLASQAAFFYYSLLENEITEDTVKKFSHMLLELVEKMKVVNAEIKEIYLPLRRSARSNFPKVEGFDNIDFLLEDLLENLESKASVPSLERQFHVVHEELKFLRSFLGDIQEQYNEHQNLESVALRIIQAIFEAEYLIDMFVDRDCLRWYHPLWLSDLVEDLKLIKVQTTEIGENSVPTSLEKAIASAKNPKIDEVEVELPDQKKLMIDRLIAGSSQLNVVSIVGMPGLGKTTLAKKVYNDISVTYHFHVRAWCCVSQAYQRRKLLLEILGDIMELTDNILEMGDEDLQMKLYQCLKRRRYLLVMDDLWGTEAWYNFKRSFPEDNNGSRILITRRLPDVAANVEKDSFIHPLRMLSEDESWKLLQKKLFDTKECPEELLEVGKQISINCSGLPLAVVAISGLLKRTNMIPGWWKQVSQTICSRITDDPETRCMDILDLSYRHLPYHLKPCFLYTGVFLEDKDIPVRKLTWLWAAEGFIPDTPRESKEDVAEGYLRDLMGSSLVMASKRRSDGGVKTCRVHDMLRTLCLLRCEEENFLQWKKGYDEYFPSNNEDLDYGIDPNYRLLTNSAIYEKHRLSIFSKRNHFVMSKPCGPRVRSLLFSATSDLRPWCPYDISFILINFKLLRILDLECINMGHAFPSGIEIMVRLGYLALSGDIDSIPESIAELINLETLLVKGLKGRVLLPTTIWSMAKLRHVHVINQAAFSLEDGIWKSSSQLHNLVSLSSPYLFCDECTENVMRRLPKLRKLRCIFSQLLDDTGKCNQFPKLNFLTELESLNVLYSGGIALPCKFEFPLNLRKLTLSKFHLPWGYISEIGKLPNLEVLKLLSKAFEGKVWEMKEGEFLKLKFLKLDSLNLAEWNASSDHLPQLQHLILRSCEQLKEVPSGFADSSTLEMIEVQLCTSSVEESVRRLQEEQLDMGNELKVLIDRSDMDF